MKKLTWMTAVAALALAGCGSRSSDETTTNQTDAEASTDYSAAEAPAEEAASEVLDEEPAAEEENLQAKMKHHAECVIAIQYATGFIENATRGVAPTAKALDGAQKMQNRLDVHIQGIKEALIAANKIGEDYGKNLAQYGNQVQQDVKDAVLKADEKDRELRSLELMNLGIGADCEA